MKNILFIEIQARFTESFLNRRLITLRWLKAFKINKFIILRLSEATKNEVMRIKIVCFGIRDFENIFFALWVCYYLKEIYFLDAFTLANHDDRRICRATQKLLAHIALLSTRRCTLTDAQAHFVC